MSRAPMSYKRNKYKNKEEKKNEIINFWNKMN